jgi:hypothetical protein
MKHIVRATTGLVLAATIATACTATREPTPTSTEHVGETKQAISGAAMTWPGTWTPLTLNGTNLSDPTGDAQGSRRRSRRPRA